MAIPVMLVWIVRRRPKVPFPEMFWLFAAFVISCGHTHLLDAISYTHPFYRFTGLIKVITAIVSWATVIAMLPTLPKIVAMPLPEELQREIDERRAAEAALSRARDELELRVAARTVELERRNAELSAANDELEAFAKAASHDLKAPLRAIDNLSQWIEEDLGPSLQAEARENMVMLRGRVRRMSAFLESLRDYVRIERGQSPSGTAVDLDELLTDTLALIAPPPEVTIRCPAPLPSVRAPRAQLQQVLLNLITNAIHHRGEVGHTVEVRATLQPGSWELRVEDDGPGIPEEHRERAFEIFQTLRPRDDVEGSGMGLAIVRKLVQNWGGTITLSDSALGGLAVTLVLPSAPEDSA